MWHPSYCQRCGRVPDSHAASACSMSALDVTEWAIVPIVIQVIVILDLLE
ncbi:hypothetical protein GFS60_03568 [Rhodococcus sp. WAY2]|nr:hypothetical protein GFS60_03568 [Rhodococcus sp. WAY2]